MGIVDFVLVAFLLLILGLGVVDWTSDPEEIDEEEKKDVEHNAEHTSDSSDDSDTPKVAKREDYSNIHI